MLQYQGSSSCKQGHLLENALLRIHFGKKNDVRPSARINSIFRITKGEKASRVSPETIFLNNTSRKFIFLPNNVCISPLAFLTSLNSLIDSIW